jgi:hypothetical protein
LDVLPAPNIGTSDGGQDVRLVINNTDLISHVVNLRDTYDIIMTQFKMAPTTHPMTWMVKVCLGDKWTY